MGLTQKPGEVLVEISRRPVRLGSSVGMTQSVMAVDEMDGSEDGVIRGRSYGIVPLEMSPVKSISRRRSWWARNAPSLGHLRRLHA